MDLTFSPSLSIRNVGMGARVLGIKQPRQVVRTLLSERDTGWCWSKRGFPCAQGASRHGGPWVIHHYLCPESGLRGWGRNRVPSCPSPISWLYLYPALLPPFLLPLLSSFLSPTSPLSPSIPFCCTNICNSAFSPLMENERKG